MIDQTLGENRNKLIRKFDQIKQRARGQTTLNKCVASYTRDQRIGSHHSQSSMCNQRFSDELTMVQKDKNNVKRGQYLPIRSSTDF